MKYLKELLEASILTDIDNTLKIGDKFIQEFEDLKKIACNYKNYNADYAHAWGYMDIYNLYTYDRKYEKLIKYLSNDLKNCNKIKVDIKKYKRTAYSDERKNGCFGIRFHFCNDHFEILKSTKEFTIATKQCRTFQLFINKVVKSIFKDIESFKEFINTNL